MPKTIDERLFGEYSRYKLVTFLTRFGTTAYLVLDAERTDPVTGGPVIIRQEDSEAAAVAGLA